MSVRALLGGVVLLALSACMEGGPETVTSAAPMSAPRFFIADQLGPTCTRDNQGRGVTVSEVNSAIARLYENSERYVADLRRSTSLTVNKDAYSANWQPVLFASYAGAASADPALTDAVITGLRRLAQSNKYQSEPGLVTREQALRLTACYEAGPNSPCASHTPRFVGRMYANFLIAAAVSQSQMTAEDRAVILPWLQTGYRRFIIPELNADPNGIYDFANMGLARLALAALTNDTRMAQREIAERRREFITRIEPSGYIDQNSFRGVRGFWYHTYGLDPVLSYALVAREWGTDFFTDPVLGPRMAAAVQKTILGITDYDAFRSVGNRGSDFSTDPGDEIKFVHQYALNLYTISAREFGVRLPPSPGHQSRARNERFSQTSGFMAQCYYSGR